MFVYAWFLIDSPTGLQHHCIYQHAYCSTPSRDILSVLLKAYIRSYTSSSDIFRNSFIWRQDSQTYFILFMFSIFQAQDGDGSEWTWKIEVASKLVCTWYQDREEQLHLITRKTWVVFIGFWERDTWRLTSYRWTDLGRSRLIVSTVRCHSYLCAHIQ